MAEKAKEAPKPIDPPPPQESGISIKGLEGKQEFFPGCSYEERDGGLILIRNGENVDYRPKGQWKDLVVHP